MKNVAPGIPKLNPLLRSSRGFTLAEAIATLVIIGVLSAIVFPRLANTFWASKPLQNATLQMQGIFRQARARAIATSRAYRIVPQPSSANGPDFVVQASQSRQCGGSTLLTQDAASTDTLLRVGSTVGFFPNDALQVGSDGTGNTVSATDPSNLTIALSSPLDSPQTAGNFVEILNNWVVVPDFSNADLTLPRSSSTIFGRTQANSTEQPVTFTANQTNWRLCFDAGGRGNLIVGNLQAINSQLEVYLWKGTAGGGACAANNNLCSTVRVSQGGAVTVDKAVINN